ncbi:DNA-binding MarR family transcriptional regulator [Desulfitispora alkaliphila]|uniref:hypothetical protein n=1 Tax=Desulfitispora alkaliphila TaxID=622674 RepID=UPI003D1BB712
MLSHIERKVLRITLNMAITRKGSPTVRDLCIKTGRSPKSMLAVIRELEQKNYLTYDGQEIVLKEHFLQHLY